MPKPPPSLPPPLEPCRLPPPPPPTTPYLLPPSTAISATAGNRSGNTSSSSSSAATNPFASTRPLLGFGLEKAVVSLEEFEGMDTPCFSAAPSAASPKQPARKNATTSSSKRPPRPLPLPPFCRSQHLHPQACDGLPSRPKHSPHCTRSVRRAPQQAWRPCRADSSTVGSGGGRRGRPLRWSGGAAAKSGAAGGGGGQAVAEAAARRRRKRMKDEEEWELRSAWCISDRVEC